MSTVVFYNGALYADTQVTHTATKNTRTHSKGDIVKVDTTRKLYRLDDNPCAPPTILGCTGHVVAHKEFIDWTMSGRSAELNYTFQSSFSAVEYDGETFLRWSIESAGWAWRKVGPKFRWRYCKANKFVILAEHRYTLADEANKRCLIATIGSGCDVAMGYLESGGHPISSILAASKYDQYTNNVVEATGLYRTGINVVYDPNKEEESPQLALDFK